VTDISADEFGLGTQCAQLSDQRWPRLIAAAGDDDTSPFTSEGTGRGTSYPREGAGNQNNGFTHRSSPAKSCEAQTGCSSPDRASSPVCWENKLHTPTGNDHLRALLGEGDGGGVPDAGKSTGDQDNLSAHAPILCWAAGNPTAFRRS
jgi:hypothetical protein